jgi:uncharacterized protein (TIGR00303 family)
MDKTLFLLVISGTDTIKHQGISAAGANHEMLPYTAALDAEFIYYGYTKTLDKLPVSPNKIVSPALISKACLNLLGIDILTVDTGAHIKSQCPYISVREKPGADISTGQAMTYAEVLELYQAGRDFLGSIKNYNHVIVAECVVGGTTTAFGLLEAMGYKCSQMLSSSLPNGNHNLKESLVHEGLSKAIINDDPLSAVAALGDPMQAFVTGLSLSCTENNIQVTLAGGTQMIAVGALIERLNGQRSTVNGMRIVTTPWIVNDKSAKFTELHQLCCPDIEVQYPDTESIRTNHLLNEQISSLTDSQLTLKLIIDRYEEGHVKEGIGMGALMNLLRNCP